MLFDRNYKMTITTSDGLEVVIAPPMRIVIDAYKSIDGGVNKGTFSVYNLKEDTRLKLVKDPIKDQGKVITVDLKIGYNGKLRTAFKGQIFRGESIKDGTDFVSKLESLDGGFDLRNTAVSETVKGKGKAIERTLANAQTITGLVTQQSELTRPRVLFGNALRIIDSMIEDGQTWWIDDGQLYILKQNEVLGGVTPKVAAETGLLEQPVREETFIEFTTLMNPSIKLGRLVYLESVVAPYLKGLHKVFQINYKGDYDGNDWLMVVRCQIGNYETIN